MREAELSTDLGHEYTLGSTNGRLAVGTAFTSLPAVEWSGENGLLMLPDGGVVLWGGTTIDRLTSFLGRPGSVDSHRLTQLKQANRQEQSYYNIGRLF